MNLKPNKHKIISFNTTAMTSLWFIGHPLKNFRSPLKFSSLPKFIFLLRSRQLCWSEIFRSPLKLGGLLPCLTQVEAHGSSLENCVWGFPFCIVSFLLIFIFLFNKKHALFDCKTS